MAFTNHSTLLKVDVFLVMVATLCAIIALAAWQMSFYHDVKGFSVCILYLDRNDPGSYNPQACGFGVGATATMLVGAVVLGGLDFVTWKRSENYKGKRACLMAMFLSVLLALVALAALGVAGFGDIKLCKNYEIACSLALPQQKGILTGIGACGVGCLTFATYFILERIQYVRRHVNGDKW